MNPLLKRELLFWLIAAAALAGYVLLGRKLAPEVPPQPKREGGVIKVGSQQELIERFAAEKKAEDAWKRAVENRREYLQQWFQFGAAGVILFVLISTWLRPPWRQSEAVTAAQPGRKSKGKRREKPAASRQSALDVLGLTPKAFFTMLATLVIVVAIILALIASVN